MTLKYIVLVLNLVVFWQCTSQQDDCSSANTTSEILKTAGTLDSSVYDEFSNLEYKLVLASNKDTVKEYRADYIGDYGLEKNFVDGVHRNSYIYNTDGYAVLKYYFDKDGGFGSFGPEVKHECWLSTQNDTLFVKFNFPNEPMTYDIVVYSSEGRYYNLKDIVHKRLRVTEARNTFILVSELESKYMYILVSVNFENPYLTDGSVVFLPNAWSSVSDVVQLKNEPDKNASISYLGWYMPPWEFL